LSLLGPLLAKPAPQCSHAGFQVPIDGPAVLLGLRNNALEALQVLVDDRQGRQFRCRLGRLRRRGLRGALPRPADGLEDLLGHPCPVFSASRVDGGSHEYWLLPGRSNPPTPTL